MQVQNSMTYSVEVIKELETTVREATLYRPRRIVRYDPGDHVEYRVTGVEEGSQAQARLVVEDFVGGGFAGQVYRVRILDLKGEPIAGLAVGGIYALKILIPPSSFAKLFRDVLYWLGFQGPFQLQVNPTAGRAGALWQKFIRRGAKLTFGEEGAVVDIHATLVDPDLGSCGELSEWVAGRTWRLEADERLDLLKRWLKGQEVDAEQLGSPEYRAKREFMRCFVQLAHELGYHEFARQYEWSTCKSQPNCLKRLNTEDRPSEGLVAVDFRAGLALLPFLPMSPGDFSLILKGLLRGSLVQFDRGDVAKLDQFVATHQAEFDDMAPMLADLKAAEHTYRNSLPDITHNHLRLLYSRRLWSSIFAGFVTGWGVRNLIDKAWDERFRQSRILALLFLLIGIVPFLGRFLRKIWCRPDWRRHYREALTSPRYLKRAVRAKAAEKVIVWYRSGRMGGECALKVARQVWRFSYHGPLSLLPTGLHRFLTDWQFAKDKLSYLTVRPVRLYFDANLREQWLREMVSEGQKNQLLTDDDAKVIFSQIKEPFIQKYLKSLAVHLCTLPVTQIVSLLVAGAYVLLNPDMPRTQAWAIGLGIIALFQVVPISPGSLVRGLYVLYLVVRERNFKDYNIAVFLGFFKYIGYLAFPIQMTYRYPTLARFMASHWATEAVHVVPVFGEQGALLEHAVFQLFYNWPLTLRRRMRKRSQLRATMAPRYWHMALCALTAAGLFTLMDVTYLRSAGALPGLKEIWALALLVPLLCGATVTLGAGGALLRERIIGAAACGASVGVIYTAVSAILGSGLVDAGNVVTELLWRVFVFGIFSVVGTLLTELRLPEPSTS
jgi:hypothetical protein